MEPIRISIPDLKPDETAVRRAAGQLAIDALREAGMDPVKAVTFPLAVALLQSWARGESSRAATINGLRNCVIMRPSLSLSTPPVGG